MEEVQEVDAFSSKMVADTPEINRLSFAVVVVDMVNDYLDPQGTMPVSDPGPVVSATTRLVDACRAAGGLVIWVRPGHTELADGLFRKRVPHAIGEGPGSQLHPDLLPLEQDKIIRKRKYSSFFGTDLDSYLREHRIESVLVSGVALNICVRSTVHDAFFHGYDVFVVEDASQATSQREHDSTLYDIATHFGTVMSVTEVETGLSTPDSVTDRDTTDYTAIERDQP